MGTTLTNGGVLRKNEAATRTNARAALHLRSRLLRLRVTPARQRR
jgi:hypothetical protein